MSRGLRTLSCSILILFAALTTAAADAPKGERVFTAGHSFHWMIPMPLEEIAKSAKIDGHESLGTQAIGGSATMQHWNLPEEKNKAKQAIQTGKVDVLTLSPILLPDAGIDNFVRLALEKNPNARILVQGSWMPFDDYFNRTKTFSNDDRNKAKIADLRAASLTFDNQLNEQVAAINARYAATQKRAVAFVVPVGHAVVSLREKILAGIVPGIAKQSDLFTDPIGHPKAAVAVLNAYCHYAVIYKQSPVGLPVPASMKTLPSATELNTLLQEIAWGSVKGNAATGVK